MRLYLVKPDLTHFEQYNQMMSEWRASGTQIAPWFLGDGFDTVEKFADFIRMLDDCEHGLTDKRFSATTSYFVIDENDRLVGAASLRHYLTYEGFLTWGHIGYGIRPSERLKGYAVATLRMMLEQAKLRHIYKVLLGVHESNIGSRKVVEKCGGILENTVRVPGDAEAVRRYWIAVDKD